MRAQIWDFGGRQPALAARLAKACEVPALVGEVLAARGCDEQKANALIGRNPCELHDPMLLRDMDRAVETVALAIQNGEMICVFGDYDCDGVAATAMVYSYLESVGARCCYYIPHREKEGYGLNIAAVNELHRLGVSVILTVDNGVSAVAEVAHANALGMRVVVTDHHMPPPVLPKAAAVVDPCRADCPYPFKELSGAAVAFKLLCALEGESGYDLLEYFSDLLAIAAVADVVALTGENRLFVKRGLARIAESPRPGIDALLHAAGMADRAITAESVAFVIAPRLNAAGRLDTADLAVMLLLSEQEDEARQLAGELEELNARRRADEKIVADDIARQLAEHPLLAARRVMVLCGEGYNAGIVGIVCARMVERYGRPCVIIAADGDEAKGSGRSVEGFSLIEAVAACAERLARYGGHPMAAGFSLAACDVQDFADRLERFAAERYPEMPPVRLRIDCEVDPAMLSVEQVEALGALEPFGCGNEPAVFAVTGARVVRVIPLSEGRHIRLALEKDGVAFGAVGFSMSPDQLGLVAGDRVDIAFSAGVEEYRGQKGVTLRLRDLRLSGGNQQELFLAARRYERVLRREITGAGLLPSREETAAVYRHLRAAGQTPFLPELLYRRMPDGSAPDYARFRIALDVLLELGLIRISRRGDAQFVSVPPAVEKVSLETSSIVRSLSDS